MFGRSDPAQIKHVEEMLLNKVDDEMKNDNLKNEKALDLFGKDMMCKELILSHEDGYLTMEDKDRKSRLAIEHMFFLSYVHNHFLDEDDVKEEFLYVSSETVMQQRISKELIEGDLLTMFDYYCNSLIKYGLIQIFLLIAALMLSVQFATEFELNGQKFTLNSNIIQFGAHLPDERDPKCYKYVKGKDPEPLFISLVPGVLFLIVLHILETTLVMLKRHEWPLFMYFDVQYKTKVTKKMAENVWK